jgi:cytochrome c553
MRRQKRIDIDQNRSSHCATGGRRFSGEKALCAPATSTTEIGVNYRMMKKILALAMVMGVAAAVSASAADGKETWDKTCAKCHGADGKGQTKMGQKMGVKDFTDAKVQADLTDDAAFKAIKEGLKDKEGKTLMKAFDDLSDADIKALVQTVRSFKK